MVRHCAHFGHVPRCAGELSGSCWGPHHHVAAGPATLRGAAVPWARRVV